VDGWMDGWINGWGVVSFVQRISLADRLRHWLQAARKRLALAVRALLPFPSQSTW
jgi:hypothetical protein